MLAYSPKKQYLCTRNGEYSKLMAENSDKAVYLAVKGMLPKNALGRQMIKKLKLFKGAEHNMQAQKPEVLNLNKAGK